MSSLPTNDKCHHHSHVTPNLLRNTKHILKNNSTVFCSFSNEQFSLYGTLWSPFDGLCSLEGCLKLQRNGSCDRSFHVCVWVKRVIGKNKYIWKCCPQKCCRSECKLAVDCKKGTEFKLNKWLEKIKLWRFD